MGFSNKKLTLYREKMGLSINKLADMCNVSKSYLSQLESGKRDNPTADTIEELARVLKIPPFELMEKSGRRKKYGSEIAPSLQEFIKKMEKSGDPISDMEVKYFSKLSARIVSSSGAYSLSVDDWKQIRKEWLQSVEESQDKKKK